MKSDDNQNIQTDIIVDGQCEVELQNQEQVNNIELIKQQSEIARKKQMKRKKLINEIFKSLIYLKDLGLTTQELINYKVFSVYPFQKKQSYDLINACKQGNYNKVNKLLQKNKYLVYDFDFCFMSGLHWACHRNHYKIAILLLKYNADVNLEDIIGRTALFLVLKYNPQNIQLIKILLYHKACPWSNNKISLQQFNSSIEIKDLLSKARRIDIGIKLGKYNQKQQIWQNQRQSLLL